MKKAEFLRLKVIEDMVNPPPLKKGDKFLYGRSLEEQKITKNVGDAISYYRVTQSSPGYLSYEPITEKMESDGK